MYDDGTYGEELCGGSGLAFQRSDSAAAAGATCPLSTSLTGAPPRWCSMWTFPPSSWTSLSPLSSSCWIKSSASDLVLVPSRLCTLLLPSVLDVRKDPPSGLWPWLGTVAIAIPPSSSSELPPPSLLSSECCFRPTSTSTRTPTPSMESSSTTEGAVEAHERSGEALFSSWKKVSSSSSFSSPPKSSPILAVGGILICGGGGVATT
mmetsp:Transcript_31851/g.66780  ORF Transcript_31851/g.66780 Transcript_31851/m.66780 type:complete len:206 (+) Transcript_31851:738-1355(+)